LTVAGFAAGELHDGFPTDAGVLPLPLGVDAMPGADSGHPRSNRHPVVAVLAVASSAAYATTGLAIISLAIAWSARGEHLRMLVPPFTVEGSDATNPGGWISVPSDYRPEMAAAAMFALLAGAAIWVVVQLHRRLPAQAHSTRRGLLWGVPLVLVVGPAIFAPIVWLTNSISFG